MENAGSSSAVDVQSGALTLGEAAGRTLVKALLVAKVLPKKIFIGGSRLQPILELLCHELQIDLLPTSSLPALDETVDALGRQMMGVDGPRRL